MLSNAEQLPSTFARVKDGLLGWYFEDEKWTGRWSIAPLSYSVNQEELREEEQLSGVDVRLEIKSKHGEIEGTIATKRICAAIPAFDFIHVTGSVSENKPRNQAEILAYDVIGGRTKDFARLTLNRTGDTMIVTPQEEAGSWFPDRAKIDRHSDDDQNEEFHDLCQEEKKHS